MIITLIGYRGCGKSTIAPILADRMGCDWIDSDRVVEETAGKTIVELFFSQGEPDFRKLESKVISDLVLRQNLVIASGGGTVLDPQNRQLIREAGPVIWLQASPETLLDRITKDSARRPILSHQALYAAIREPLCRECASLIIDTESKSISDIVEEIVTFVMKDTIA